MNTLKDYTDLRELAHGYTQQICANCGTETWFQLFDEDWRCTECHREPTYVLEYPCPECGTRLEYERGFQCNYCGAEPEFQKEQSEYITTLSDGEYRKGYPGVLMGECPICGDETSVNGGPDGELMCNECNDFYAGQYSTLWYTYAHWLEWPSDIEVRE